MQRWTRALSSVTNAASAPTSPRYGLSIMCQSLTPGHNELISRKVPGESRVRERRVRALRAPRPGSADARDGGAAEAGSATPNVRPFLDPSRPLDVNFSCLNKLKTLLS